MDGPQLSGGFKSPATQSATAFRAIMEAMARPGRIQPLAGARPPAPLSVSAGTVLLALCDAETPLYLAGDAECKAVRSWIAFHIGAPCVGPSDATFAVGSWAALQPLAPYPLGRTDYPDRSATLIVELSELDASGMRLTGPGIAQEAQLSLPETAAFVANRMHFPCGLDFIFTCGDRVAALPRTTKVHVPEHVSGEP